MTSTIYPKGTFRSLLQKLVPIPCYFLMSISTIGVLWENYQILVTRALTNMEMILYLRNVREEVETLVYSNSQNDAQIRWNEQLPEYYICRLYPTGHGPFYYS